MRVFTSIFLILTSMTLFTGAIVELWSSRCSSNEVKSKFFPWWPSRQKGLFEQTNDPEDVQFHLYTNTRNFEDYTEVCWNKLSQDYPWIKGADVKIIIHGFLQDGSSRNLQAIKDAYHKRTYQNQNGTSPLEQYNVIIVDWRHLSGASPRLLDKLAIPYLYPRAVINTRGVGIRVGEMIMNLKNFGVVESFDKIHLIGFSLGAHVAGYAGDYVRRESPSQRVRRITALDPAGPAFYRPGNWLFGSRAMQKIDAKFIDVLHTSYGFYGMGRDVGHVDFYANPHFHMANFQVQRECRYLPNVLLLENACSHNLAPLFFAKAIMNHTFLACPFFPDEFKHKLYNVDYKKCDDSEKVEFGEDAELHVKTYGKEYAFDITAKDLWGEYDPMSTKPSYKKGFIGMTVLPNSTSEVEALKNWKGDGSEFMFFSTPNIQANIPVDIYVRKDHLEEVNNGLAQTGDGIPVLSSWEEVKGVEIPKGLKLKDSSEEDTQHNEIRRGRLNNDLVPFG